MTSGSSALDLTKVALEANDIDAVAAGSFILSLKYNGVELGTPLDYSTYWQLFINGKSSDYTADNVTIHAGDTVTWFYGGWGDQLPSDSVHASVQVLGKDKDGKQQVWASTGQTSLKAGSTAKDLLEQTGLKLDAGESSWGWFLNGIYSPFDDESYCGYDAATNSYWRFYVKGKSDVKYKLADVGAGATSSMRAMPSPLCMVLTPMPSWQFLGLSMLSAPMSTATILAGARQAMFLCPKALRPRTLLRRF